MIFSDFQHFGYAENSKWSELFTTLQLLGKDIMINGMPKPRPSSFYWSHNVEYERRSKNEKGTWILVLLDETYKIEYETKGESIIGKISQQNDMGTFGPPNIKPSYISHIIKNYKALVRNKTIDKII